VGGEGEWPAWITGGSSYDTRQAPSRGFALATHLFKFIVFNDPSWDYSGYDVANARKDARLAATFMNATNPDLDAFKAKGRKLIVWHGWSDAALTALGSIEYYDEVRKRDDGVRDYFRLFLMPGVLHCSGGPGPDTVDWPATLADWVENGKAPDRVIARKAAPAAPCRGRVPCARIRSMRSTRAPAARTTRRTSSAVSHDSAGLISAEAIIRRVNGYEPCGGSIPIRGRGFDRR
jgi:hypothetical protein